MTDYLFAVERYELPNGGTLFVHPRPELPVAFCMCMFKTGSIHEEQFAGCGISHVVEHMLFQGCEKYPGNSAAQRIAELGGSCDAGTSFDYTEYHAEVPSERWAEVLDVLAAMVTRPLFAEKELQSELKVILREAEMWDDNPSWRLTQHAFSDIFPSHPARFPIIGYPDKIAGITSSMLSEYYRKRYGAMRSFWVVAGKVDGSAVAECLSEKLAGFPRGNLAEPTLPVIAEQSGEKRTLHRFADPLCRIDLAVRTPNAGQGATMELDLLSGIAGQNASSRLVRELCQKQQLALDVSSYLYSESFGGFWNMVAVCRKSQRAMLEKKLRSELENLRHHGVTQQELKREKLQQKLQYFRTMQSNYETANLIANGVLQYNDPLYAARYQMRLQQVSQEAVHAAAERYLNPEAFLWNIQEPQMAPKASPKQVASAGDSRKSGTAIAVPPALLADGRLPRGSQYLLLPRGKAPLYDLTIMLPLGSCWESNEQAGLGTLLAAVLSAGPKEMSESHFNDLCDNHGIDFTVQGGNNVLTVDFNFPKNAEKLVWKLAASLLRAPRFSAADFQREQRNLLEYLSSRNEDSRYAAMSKAQRLLFGNSSAAHMRSGTPETVAALRLEDLQNAYFQRGFDPEWIKVGATCDYDDPGEVQRMQQALACLENALPIAQTIARLTPPEKLTFPGPLARELEAFEERSSREQSAVVYGWQVPDAFCRKERVAFEIFEQALNRLGSSSIFNAVRESNALAYAVYATTSINFQCGWMAMYAGTAPERAEEALALLRKESRNSGSCALSEAEFQSAKLSVLRNAAKRAEQPRARLLEALLGIFYGDTPALAVDGVREVKQMKYHDFLEAIGQVYRNGAKVSVIAGKRLRA